LLKAVFFDVDFTLIYPGPMFRGEGYRAFGRRYGLELDEARFEAGVASAGALLEAGGDAYDAEIFIRYAAHIIEHMGGAGEGLTACAREIYDEWAACHHFELYEEVPAVLREIAGSGYRIGLISNTHRSLASFESHFELTGLIAAAVASSEHGFMKPHPSIFEAALKLMDVRAEDSVMIGDNVRHDVDGALAVGMSAVLLHRAEELHPRARELDERGVPIVDSLSRLPAILAAMRACGRPAGADGCETPSGRRRGSY
jgi:putative hydrolase of the HAD superfamily